MIKKKLILLTLGIIIILTALAIKIQASDSQIIVKINIEPEYTQISPSEEVIIQIALLSLNTGSVKDVKIKTSLFNEDKDEISIKEQTLALETQASFIKTVKIPENVKEGVYEIQIEVTDISNEELLGIASQRVIVTNKNILESVSYDNVLKLALSILILSLIIFLIFLWIKIKQLHKIINNNEVNQRAYKKLIIQQRAEKSGNVISAKNLIKEREREDDY